VKRHIRLLHDYNEIKDIAQGLMGLIAEARGVRHVDVQREYGVKEQD
jgi:DNA repair protein Swi5/Sae3